MLERSIVCSPGVLAVAADNTEIQVQQSYEQVLEPGEVLFDEGDPGDVMYVVQSGEIELTRSSRSGGDWLAQVGPGDFFGEMSAVTGEPRSARATAISDCRLLELDAETLEDLCIERPEFAVRMIRRLSARLIEVERRVLLLGGEGLVRPVVRALVASAQASGDAGSPVSESLRSLAEAAGLSMRDAHRALQQLLDRKLVRLVDDVLIAPDPTALTRCLAASAKA